VTGASTGAAGIAAARGAGALVAASGAGVGVTDFAVVAGAAVGAGATSDPEAGATPVRGSGRAPAELATKDLAAPPRRGSMTGIARKR